jgi:mono/diheme cytochrome c family protein
MMNQSSSPVLLTLALIFGLGQAACNPKSRSNNEVGAAPIDTASATSDTARPDTLTADKPDTSSATPPVTPSSTATASDTPPSGASKPTQEANAGGGAKLSKLEYEGWRQYNVHCARCHGQDVLPNPVAANLLLSLGPGGAFASEAKFAEIVKAGRAASGMPPFKDILTEDQTKAIYAYVKGRADKRIPPGRPASPA